MLKSISMHFIVVNDYKQIQSAYFRLTISDNVIFNFFFKLENLIINTLF